MIDQEHECPAKTAWKMRQSLSGSSISERRLALTTEALSWQPRTQFQHGQCVKNVEADCSTFLAACFRTVGLFCADIPNLQPDWFLHCSKQFYLEELQKHAVEFTLAEKNPEPGDIVIVKDVAIGAKVFSHGAIVLRWAGIRSEVIHCFPPCVMTSNPFKFPAFAGKNLKFFDPFQVKK